MFRIPVLKKNKEGNSKKTSPEAEKKIPTSKQPWRPLCIGCSGGGGHNTAIQAIIGDLQNKENILMTSYLSTLYKNKAKNSAQQDKINVGLKMMDSSPYVRDALKRTSQMHNIPILPTREEINNEIAAIEKTQTASVKKGEVATRAYIDMLLDVYPSGYENAAIWNILQRKDQTQELKKLVSLQGDSDAENYEIVKVYFSYLLENANPPYTEIMSTQAMALPALCDAVIEYNKAHPKNEIKIKQYLTDIATKGAVHFFSALQKLTLAQRSVMELYGVGLTENLLQEMKLANPLFANFPDNNYEINPQDNPMVRAAFKELKSEWKEDYLPILTSERKNDQIKINKTDKIAAIMLGSQGNEESFNYVKALLEKNKADRIFVFGGEKEPVKNMIINYLNEQHITRDKVILLSNQNDEQIAPIMRRSNIIITRAGGLSVMEQMAVHAELSEDEAKNKAIFIHHKETGGKLSSGISWEDENANRLIDYLRDRGIRSEKTTSSRIGLQIGGVRETIDDAIKKIQGINNSIYTAKINRNSFSITNIFAKSRQQDYQTTLTSLIAYLMLAKSDPKMLPLNMQDRFPNETKDLQNIEVNGLKLMDYLESMQLIKMPEKIPSPKPSRKL